MAVAAAEPFPTPVPDERSQPFFDGAAAGRLMIQRCRTCGTHMVPGRVRCDQCLGVDLEWVQASGRATVHSWTTVHQRFHPAFATPYEVAVVKLAEGPCLVTQLVDCPAPRLGQAVAVVFAPLPGGLEVPRFRPAG